MLARYASLSQDKRERIIFKDKFDCIEEAIKMNKKLYITTMTDKKNIISPYKIVSAREELFNYLLAEMNGKTFTFRISRLKSVTLINEKKTIREENIPFFEKMILYGPQFTIRKNEEIVVYLSDEGIRRYHDMYVHRPVVKRIEGHLYYFDCSKTQVLQFFYRFHKEAQILKPISLRNQMIHMIEEAHTEYLNLNTL